MACLMTPTSWVSGKGRLASEERDGYARELNRGRCADMWVSPQIKDVLMHSLFTAFTFLTKVCRKYNKFIKLLRFVNYNSKVRTQADSDVVLPV